MVILILTDLALLLAWFTSIFLAMAWGEMASYPLQGDKSGLSGLGMVPIFMMFRWPILAIALTVAAYRDGFAGLPGGKGAQAIGLVAIHAALGAASMGASSWIISAIQRSDPGPLRFAWIFALVLPIVTFSVVFFGLHRSWIPRHPWITGILFVLLLWSHYGLWREGYVRTPAAQPPAPPASP